MANASRAADAPADVPAMDKLAASLVIRDDAGRVLVVRRPDDPDDDIGGMWGFPATSARPGERAEDVALRVAELKLGVKVALGRQIGSSTRERQDARLTMVDYEARIVEGTPVVPQADQSVTQYVELRYVEDPMIVADAARAGSQCTQLYLDDLGIAWR